MTAAAEGEGDRPAVRRWRVSHAAAAFAAGVLASVAAALAALPGGVTVFEAFAVVGVAQTLVTIAVVVGLARSPAREPLGFRFTLLDAGGVLLGPALAVAAGLVTYLLAELVLGGNAPVQGVVQIADQAADRATITAMVVVTLLGAPLAEELVFRGVLLRALGHRFGPAAALYGSAAAFALTHLALDFDAAMAVPALFGVGVVLGWLVQRTGRLGAALATHTGFNLVGVLGVLLD